MIGGRGTGCVWRSEVNFVESVLSFNVYVGSGIGLRLLGLLSKCLSAEPSCWPSKKLPGCWVWFWHKHELSEKMELQLRNVYIRLPWRQAYGELS